VSSVVKPLRFDDFAAAQAGGADAHAFGGGADAGVHRAQVNVPAPLGDVVGVADAVSRLRLLAADIALLCHDDSKELRSCGANLNFTGI
jgi:hypothetical protein